MTVPVKLSLYAVLLAAVFGAAFFTAQVVAEADRAGDWRPQIHEIGPATAVPDPLATTAPVPPDQHGDDGHEEETP